MGGQTVQDPDDGERSAADAPGPIHDPTALIYVRTSDLTPFNVLSAAELAAFDISSQLTTTTTTLSTDTTTSTTALAAIPATTNVTATTTDTVLTLDAAATACLAGGAANVTRWWSSNTPIEPIVLRANAGGASRAA